MLFYTGKILKILWGVLRIKQVNEKIARRLERGKVALVAKKQGMWKDGFSDHKSSSVEWLTRQKDWSIWERTWHGLEGQTGFIKGISPNSTFPPFS